MGRTKNYKTGLAQPLSDFLTKTFQEGGRHKKKGEEGVGGRKKKEEDGEARDIACPLDTIPRPSPSMPKGSESPFFS